MESGQRSLSELRSGLLASEGQVFVRLVVDAGLRAVWYVDVVAGAPSEPPGWQQIWRYSDPLFIATPMSSATLAAALDSTSGGVLAGLPGEAENEDGPMRGKWRYVERRIRHWRLPELLTLGRHVAAVYDDDRLLNHLLGLDGPGGVRGEMKNLIFAADGPKPKIVLRDGMGKADKCDPWNVGKRASFIETATNRLRFLVDEQGSLGPETEKDKFVSGISTVRYHRNDMTIEVVQVVGSMGEAYVETRCRRETDNEQGDLTHLGRNTTHTDYQPRRALDLQADAVCSYLGLT